MYLKGHGVERDNTQARGWFRAAALQDDVVSLSQLGLMQLIGKAGLLADSKAAKTLLERAAAQGDADAQFNLAVLFEEGRGVTQEAPAAARYYALAAAQGHLAAQTNLGLLYIEGRGVKRNLATAYQWIEAAASRGYAKASYALGVMEAEGLIARGPSTDSIESTDPDRG